MEAIIEAYKTWLRANSKAEKTIVAYIQPVKDILTALNISDPKMITEAGINEYFANMKQKYSQATINKYISALDSFLDFQNILIRLPKTKEPARKEVEVLSSEDFYGKIIPFVENNFSDSLRVKAILNFLYYAGLRKEDSIKIKRSQFDLATNELHIFIEKQNIYKMIPMARQLKEVLELYFISEAEESNAFNLSISKLNRIFQVLKDNFPELKLHPHKFRASCFTNAGLLGLQDTDIQKMAGHKQLSTTMRYVRKTDKEIKDKYLKLEEENLKKQRKERKNDKSHE